MKINKKQLEHLIGKNKIIFLSMFVFVFAFGMILIFNKGTYSIEDDSGNSVSIVCPDTIAAGYSIKCEVRVNAVTMAVQGVVGRHHVVDGLTFVSFKYDENVWNSYINDDVGFVLVNKSDDGVVGESVIGTVEYAINVDAKANSFYQIGFEEFEIGDGEDQTINFDSVYDEVRVLSNINTLDSLSITGISLNEEYNKNNNNYSANVDTDKITINAVKTDKYSKVSGDVGELNVHYGINVFEVVVTSEDGTINKYVITVYRDYEFTTDKYVYNKEDNYLYTGMDVNSDVILGKINVPAGISRKIENGRLFIMAGDMVMEEITLVNISSKDYNLFNEHIYLGTSEELDISKIAMLNCTHILENDKLTIKYGDNILDEFKLLKVSFGDLKEQNNVLILDDDMSYNDFIDNITVSNDITYKLFNGNNEVTSGNILNDMIIKFYYNGDVIDSFRVDNYSLLINSSGKVDGVNKYIIYDVAENTVASFLDDVVVTGGNVRTVITSSTGDVKNSDNYIGTGDLFTVYSGDNKKDEYVFKVMGDSNGDGKLNGVDLVQLRKHIVEYVNPTTGVVEIKTGIYKDVLDISGDGIVNSLDVVRMRKRIVGLE